MGKPSFNEYMGLFNEALRTYNTMKPGADKEAFRDKLALLHKEAPRPDTFYMSQAAKENIEKGDRDSAAQVLNYWAWMYSGDIRENAAFDPNDPKFDNIAQKAIATMNSLKESEGNHKNMMDALPKETQKVRFVDSLIKLPPSPTSFGMSTYIPGKTMAEPKAPISTEEAEKIAKQRIINTDPYNQMSAARDKLQAIGPEVMLKVNRMLYMEDPENVKSLFLTLPKEAWVPASTYLYNAKPGMKGIIQPLWKGMADFTAQQYSTTVDMLTSFLVRHDNVLPNGEKALDILEQKRGTNFGYGLKDNLVFKDKNGIEFPAIVDGKYTKLGKGMIYNMLKDEFDDPKELEAAMEELPIAWTSSVKRREDYQREAALIRLSSGRLDKNATLATKMAHSTGTLVPFVAEVLLVSAATGGGGTSSFIGAYGASYLGQVGSVRQHMLEAGLPEKDANTWSLIATVPIAALDTVATLTEFKPAAEMIKDMFKFMEKNWASKMLSIAKKRALLVAAEEVPTEDAQSIIEDVTVTLMKEYRGLISGDKALLKEFLHIFDDLAQTTIVTLQGVLGLALAPTAIDSTAVALANLPMSKEMSSRIHPLIDLINAHGKFNKQTAELKNGTIRLETKDGEVFHLTPEGEAAVEDENGNLTPIDLRSEDEIKLGVLKAAMFQFMNAKTIEEQLQIVRHTAMNLGMTEKETFNELKGLHEQYEKHISDRSNKLAQIFQDTLGWGVKKEEDGVETPVGWLARRKKRIAERAVRGTEDLDNVSDVLIEALRHLDPALADKAKVFKTNQELLDDPTIPQSVKDMVASGVVVNSFYHNGKVIFVEENIVSPGMAVAKVYHEAVVHANLDAMSEENKAKALDDLVAIFSALPMGENSETLFDILRLTIGNSNPAAYGFMLEGGAANLRMAAEEIAAHLAEDFATGTDLTPAKRTAFDKLRTWAQGHFGITDAQEWTDRNFAELLYGMLKGPKHLDKLYRKQKSYARNMYGDEVITPPDDKGGPSLSSEGAPTASGFGTGQGTRAFFGAFADAEGDEWFMPQGEYQPAVPLNASAQEFSSVRSTYSGNFDQHIITSIPAYDEVQNIVGAALVKTYDNGAKVLDIGASEGSFLKALNELSNGNIKSVALDPNPDMKRVFEEKGHTQGISYVMEAFGPAEEEGKFAFNDEKTGEPINYFDPKGEKFDVVHEAMTFQFLNNNRGLHIRRTKELLTEDGVAVFEEKFAQDPDVYNENERKKDYEWKTKYYTQEQIERKRAEVLAKGGDKIEGMTANQVTIEAMHRLLAENFKHFALFWGSGNFRGYLASDSKAALEKMLGNMQSTQSDFSTTETPVMFSAEDAPSAAEVNAPAIKLRLEKEQIRLKRNKRLQLTHFSDRQLAIIVPNKDPNISKGRERLRAHNRGYVARSYFGAPGYIREDHILGDIPHYVEIDPEQLYDYAGDPLGLANDARQQVGVTGGGKPIYAGLDYTKYEGAIQEAGFKGFLVGKVAALFEPVKADKVGEPVDGAVRTPVDADTGEMPSPDYKGDGAMYSTEGGGVTYIPHPFQKAGFRSPAYDNFNKMAEVEGWKRIPAAQLSAKLKKLPKQYEWKELGIYEWLDSKAKEGVKVTPDEVRDFIRENSPSFAQMFNPNDVSPVFVKEALARVIESDRDSVSKYLESQGKMGWDDAINEWNTLLYEAKGDVIAALDKWEEIYNTDYGDSDAPTLAYTIPPHLAELAELEPFDLVGFAEYEDWQALSHHGASYGEYVLMVGGHNLTGGLSKRMEEFEKLGIGEYLHKPTGIKLYSNDIENGPPRINSLTRYKDAEKVTVGEAVSDLLETGILFPYSEQEIKIARIAAKNLAGEELPVGLDEPLSKLDEYHFNLYDDISNVLERNIDKLSEVISSQEYIGASQAYHPPHFHHQNGYAPFAHTRLTFGENGTLVIQEIQSDVAQQARKKGLIKKHPLQKSGAPELAILRRVLVEAAQDSSVKRVVWPSSLAHAKLYNSNLFEFDTVKKVEDGTFVVSDSLDFSNSHEIVVRENPEGGYDFLSPVALKSETKGLHPSFLRLNPMTGVPQHLDKLPGWLEVGIEKAEREGEYDLRDKYYLTEESYASTYDKAFPKEVKKITGVKPEWLSARDAADLISRKDRVGRPDFARSRIDDHHGWSLELTPEVRARIFEHGAPMYSAENMQPGDVLSSGVKGESVLYSTEGDALHKLGAPSNKNVPIISPDFLRGEYVTIVLGDRMRVGKYVASDGTEIELHGGPFFGSKEEHGYSWAVSKKHKASNINKAVNRTMALAGGKGSKGNTILIAVGSPEQLRSSTTFARVYTTELRAMLERGEVSKTHAMRWINTRKNAVIQSMRAEVVKKRGEGASSYRVNNFTSVDELESALLNGPYDFRRMLFERLTSYADKSKLPNIKKLIDELAEPALQGLPTAAIVAAARVDPGYILDESAHPDYPYAFNGELLGMLEYAIDVQKLDVKSDSKILEKKNTSHIQRSIDYSIPSMVIPGGGKVTYSAEEQAQIDAVREVAKANPAGFTYDLKTGEEIIPGTRSGYTVAYADTQNSFGRQGLVNAFRHAKRHNGIIGGWLDPKTQKFYYDSIKIVPEFEEAKKMAQEEGQLAIFDLKNAYLYDMEDEKWTDVSDDSELIGHTPYSAEKGVADIRKMDTNLAATEMQTLLTKGQKIGMSNIHPILQRYPNANIRQALEQAISGADMVNTVRRSARMDPAAQAYVASLMSANHQAWDARKQTEKAFQEGVKLGAKRERASIHQESEDAITPVELEQEELALVDPVEQLDMEEKSPYANREGRAEEEDTEESRDEEVTQEELLKTPQPVGTIENYIKRVRNLFALKTKAHEGTPAFIDGLRATMQNALRIAVRSLTYGRARESLLNHIDKMRGLKTEKAILNHSAKILAKAFEHGAYQSRKTLISELYKGIRRATKGKGAGSKVVPWTKSSRPKLLVKYMKMVKKAIDMKIEDVEARIDELNKELADGLAKYHDSKGNDKIWVGYYIQDLQTELEVLSRFGALNKYYDDRTPYHAISEVQFAVDKALQMVEEMIEQQSEKLEKRGEIAQAHREAVISAIKASKGRVSRKKIDQAIQGWLTYPMSFEDMLKDLIGGLADSDASKKAIWGKRPDAGFLRSLSTRINTAQHNIHVRRMEAMNSLIDAVSAIWQIKPGRTQAVHAQVVLNKLLTPKDSMARFSKYGNPLSILQVLQQIALIEDPDFAENTAVKERAANLEAMKEAVGPEALKLLDWFREFYRSQRVELSDKKKEITGIGFPSTLSDLYMPATIELLGGIRGTHVSLQVTPAIFNERVKHNIDLDEDDDILSVWLERTQKAAVFLDMGNITMELEELFGDHKVQQAIKEVYGKKYLKHFMDFVFDVSSQTPLRSSADKGNGGQWLLSAHGIMMFMNIGSAVRQPSSMWEYALDHSILDVMKWSVNWMNPEMIPVIKKIFSSKQARARRYGGVSYTEALSTEGSMFSGHQTISSFFQELLRRVGYAPNKFMDALTISTIGAGVYSAYYDSLIREGKSPKEAEKLAMDWLWSESAEHQQSPFTSQQAPWQRHGGVAHKLFGGFMATPQQFLSKQNQRYRYGKRTGNWKPFIMSSFIHHVLGPITYKTLEMMFNAAFGRPPDEDEWKEWLGFMLLGPYAGSMYGRIILSYTISAILDPDNPMRRDLEMIPAQHAIHSVVDIVSIPADIVNGDGDKALKKLDSAAKVAPPYRYARDLMEDE